MKYRIKEEYIKKRDGRIISHFYPQHKHWWCPFWHYYGVIGEFEDHECFNTLEEAKSYIDWEKSKRYTVSYTEI